MDGQALEILAISWVWKYSRHARYTGCLAKLDLIDFQISIPKPSFLEDDVGDLDTSPGFIILLLLLSSIITFC
jgi:hypothetical protein